MILGWPDPDDVAAMDPRLDTMRLLRLYHQLPDPDTDEEWAVTVAVQERLAAANSQHVETICNATGYAIPI